MLQDNKKEASEEFKKDTKITLYGKIVKIFPEKTITTHNGRECRIKNCVFEYGKGKYKACFGFTIFNDKIDEIVISEGMKGWASLNLRGQKYGDESYSCSAVCWRFVSEEYLQSLNECEDY